MVDGSLLHYVVIHKITKNQVVVADPGKLLICPKSFEVWTGVLILLIPSTIQKTMKQGIFSRFFGLLIPQKVDYKYISGIIFILS